MSKIVTLISDSLEFLIISILVTAAGLFIGGWKKHMEYPIAAIILGTVFGIVASFTPMLEPFKFIAAVLGAAVGPKTLASLQNKTLKDVLTDYVKKEQDIQVLKEEERVIDRNVKEEERLEDRRAEREE